MAKLTDIIEKLKVDLELLDCDIEEYNEYYGGDDFNVMDASGGNFDDAYDLGCEHGELFARYHELNRIIAMLSEVTE